VLIELLRALDPVQYQVALLIGHHLGPLEVLRPRIPAHVAVHYAVEHPLLTRIRRKKAEGYLHPAEKALGEALLPPIHAALHRAALRRLAPGMDAVIDFDTTLAPYIHTVPAGVRRIAYLHFSPAHTWKGQRAKREKLARRLGQYHRVVMLCDEMLEAMAALHPALAPRLVRIYNAVDTARVRTLAAAGGDDLPAHPYFAAVGRLQERQKDFSTLIRAYAAGVRRWDWTEDLVIVGDGQSRADLEALVDAAGVRNRVRFAGFQANPYRWMQGARALLFASRYEGLPTVIIEAHALRLPVVATACPTGVRELLADGRAGALVPVGDADAMAAAVEQLRSNAALRDGYLAASEKLLESFSLVAMLRGFEALLRD